MSKSENICVTCGLCCDGTLFSYGKINADEIIDSSFAFPITITKTGEKSFEQSCCYFKEKVCTIYAYRPYSVCGAFKCKQLKLILSDEINYEDALQVINDTIKLRNSIEQTLSIEFPLINAPSLNKKIEDFQNYIVSHPDPVTIRKKYFPLLLEIGKLRATIKKYFLD